MIKEDFVVLHLGNQVVTIKFGKFEDEINADDLCRIDYGNLYGEAVTVSALMNRIGILRAEAEYIFNQKKLEYEVREAQLRKDERRKANSDGTKITEKALEDIVLLDEGLIVMRNNIAKAEKDFKIMEALYYAILSKDKKLNNILKPLTPQELGNEIIEGRVNGLVISKNKSKLV